MSTTFPGRNRCHREDPADPRQVPGGGRHSFGEILSPMLGFCGQEDPMEVAMKLLQHDQRAREERRQRENQALHYPESPN